MPKILVILTGYPCARVPWGSNGETGTPDKENLDSFFVGYKYLKNALKNVDVDYLCVTWDDVGKNLIENFYYPVLYKSYSQEKFRMEIDGKLQEFESIRSKLRNDFYSDLNMSNDLVGSSIRIASQLQSRCFGAALALKHAKKTSCEYDGFLMTRYDISFRGGALVRHPTKLDNNDLNFLNSKEPRFILPRFNQLNCGLPDMWLYMNEAGLNYYEGLAKSYVSDITNEKSEYIKLLTTGWPQSRFFSFENIYDYRQFSNEIFRKNKNLTLMRYPQWEASNTHAYYKFFLQLSSNRPPNLKILFKTKFEILVAMLKFVNLKSQTANLLIELLKFTSQNLKILVSRFRLQIQNFLQKSFRLE